LDLIFVSFGIAVLQISSIFAPAFTGWYTNPKCRNDEAEGVFYPFFRIEVGKT
jgi:hypothetical protein